MNTLIIKCVYSNHFIGGNEVPHIQVELIYNDEKPRWVSYERVSYPNWEYLDGENEPIMSDEVTRLWHGEAGDQILNELWYNGSGSIKIEA